MNHEWTLPSRRGLFRSAGLGLGASLIPGLWAETAALAAPAASGEIWYGEYWAEKGPVRLAMYRKRKGAPKAGEKPRPVLFLVHGSSLSARGSFDTTAPGLPPQFKIFMLKRYGV